MTDDLPPTPLGHYLHQIRKARRYSQQLLGDQAGVSPAYIRQLERGYNPDTGRPVEPSPRVLRALATALADPHPEDAPEIYLGLMEAAGYGPFTRTSSPVASTAADAERARIQALIEAKLSSMPEPMRSALLDVFRDAIGD